MEPLFFKAENLARPTEAGKMELASMEPLFFKAENAGGPTTEFAASRASMEPLFFKAENRTFDRRNAPRPILLQWSRFFSKRKMRFVHIVERDYTRFNGAAFFQSGK